MRKKSIKRLVILLFTFVVIILSIFIKIIKYVENYNRVIEEHMDKFSDTLLTQLNDEYVLNDELSIINIRKIFDGKEHMITEIDINSVFGNNILDSYGTDKSFKIISNHCVPDSMASAMLSIMYNPEKKEFELILRNDNVGENSIINRKTYSIKNNDVIEHLK